MQAATFIALLRGINVSGRNKIPMLELRSLCGEIGWRDVQTYIQSGNLVFKASGPPARLEVELERALEGRFGLSIHTIVRAATDWPAYVKSNPYPGESKTEPNRVMLALSKIPPKQEAVEKLRERLAKGEHIVQVADALWLHYGGGVAKSKLSPALLDRLVGSPVTTRNWRTVLKLNELACGFSSEE
jgi:uncharacterized protein (DUF1697 family)